MILLFFVPGLLSLLLLVLVGLSLMQFASPDEKLPVLESLPFAWGLGVLFLYIAGGLLVRLALPPNAWPWILVLLGVLTICCALRMRRASAPPVPQKSLPSSLSVYESILLALLSLKIGLVFIIAVTNPVIDADATGSNLWVGLAKRISWDGLLGSNLPYTFYLGPSLLPAWVAAFLPRWHDSLISLPWFVTYLAIIGVAYVAVNRAIGNRLAAMVLAYAYASLPLAVTHAIRPGYSDLIVSYFVIAGVAAAFQIINLNYCGTRKFNLIVIMSIAGSLLTKHEGIMWSGVIALVITSFYLVQTKGWTWKNIVVVESGAGFSFLTLVVLRPDIINRAWIDIRIKQLLDFTYDSNAPLVFMQTLWNLGYATSRGLAYSSFHLIWWWFLLFSLSLWIKKAASQSKILVLYSTLPLLLVFYLASFTPNVKYTLLGTNVSRVALQISGFLLPLYCLFITEVLGAEKQTNYSEAEAENDESAML